MPIHDTKIRITERCPCCGSKTRKTTGTATLPDGDSATYLAIWTDRQPDHGIAFLIAPHDVGAFVSVLFSFEHDSFMVADPCDYSWDDTGDIAILQRSDVIGSALAGRVFGALDEIWLHDRRLKRFHSKHRKRE